MPMSELGRVEERHGIDMNFYLLPCKAETGLGSDILPQELQECMPVDQISVEAGKRLLSFPIAHISSRRFLQRVILIQIK